MSTEQAQGQSKYGERLRQSDQQKAEADVQFAVEEAKQSLASDKLVTKKQIAKLERELNGLKNSTTFNASSIVAKQVELEGYQEGLKRLEALEAELF